MTQRSGIVTVSLGDFRCRLEGFADPLGALAAVAPWLATAPWGEDGPGDPPARGAPGGVRRAIRNGALVLTPAGGEADAADPRLRPPDEAEPAPLPGLEAPPVVAAPPAARPEAPGGRAAAAEPPALALALGGTFERGPDAAANLRLLARLARAAEGGDDRDRDFRAPAPGAAGPPETPPARGLEDAGHAGAAAAGSAFPPSGSDTPSPGADGGREPPAGPEPAGDPLAPGEAGLSSDVSAPDAVEPMEASDARAERLGGTGSATTPLAPPDGPSDGGAAPPVAALRPRRPVLPVASGGSPRVARPEAPPGRRAEPQPGALPPLRLLPAQRVEPPLAAPPGAPIRPRRPVRRPVRGVEPGAVGR